MNTFLESPYQPGFGARPAVLVGREEQLNRARANLARTANSRSATPSVLVLTGSRGLGKTVTLGAVAEEADQRGFVTVSVAFDSVSQNNPRLLGLQIAEAVAGLDPAGSGGSAGSVGSSAGERGGVAELWQRVRDRLAALSVEVNAGVVKVTSNPVTTGSASPAASHPAATAAGGEMHDSQRQALGRLLVDSAELVARSGGAGIALLIDELQEAPHDQLVVLANAFQDSLSSRPSPPLAIFAAGLPETPDRVIAAASFTERFDFRVLGRLGEDAAARALLEPALQVGVSWDAAAADAVLGAAGGSPYLLQRLGDEAWVRVAPSAGTTIPLTAAESAIADTRESLAAGMFRGRWTKATPAEQALMAAIAHVADADGVATTTDITAVLQRTTPQLSTPRKGLLDKGLVESAGTGRLRFTMPGFDEFVRTQTDVPRAGPTPIPPGQTASHRPPRGLPPTR